MPIYVCSNVRRIVRTVVYDYGNLYKIQCKQSKIKVTFLTCQGVCKLVQNCYMSREGVLQMNTAVRTTRFITGTERGEGWGTGLS
jgi:hypothetical protein